MNGGKQSPHTLHKVHSQTPLMLCWGTFSEWGSDHAINSVAKHGFQYVAYGLQQPGLFSSTLLGRLNNGWHCIDAHDQDWAGSGILWFLTWKAANTSSMNHCNQSQCQLPKIHSQKLLTLLWCLFSDEAVTLSFTLLPRNAARIFIMDSTDHVTLQLPYLQD
jgi:hypothetical protein